jgi:GLPGLI family protein
MNFSRIFAIVALTTFTFFKSSAQEAKVISDCTVSFDIKVEDPKADPQIIKAMSRATKVIYIKGSKTRSDLETPNFKQTMIYDSKSDSVVILREIGNNKYISYLDLNKWKEKNKKYEGVKFSNTDEKKTILGYECNKVVASLADGSTYNVYYTPAIIPSNTNYEYQFRSLPGFVLEYEGQSEDGKTKIRYSAAKITLVPVPVAKFDLPKTGYRVL